MCRARAKRKQSAAFEAVMDPCACRLLRVFAAALDREAHTTCCAATHAAKKIKRNLRKRDARSRKIDALKGRVHKRLSRP